VVRTLVREALAVTPLSGGSGRIAVADANDSVTIVDARTGRHLPATWLRGEELLAAGARATAGIEATDGWLDLLGPGGQPATIDPATTGTEVRP
jgi:hypothetical protein